MKKFFNYFLPLGAATFIIFFALPTYGGNLQIFLQKMAGDWDIPILAMQIIATAVLALILCIVFGLAAKIAIWLAVVLVLVAIFMPAALQDLPIVSEETIQKIEQTVEEKVEKIRNN